MVEARHIIFEATESSGNVSGILLQPDKAQWMYVLAHGAGAGMSHSFLEAIAEGLFKRGVATFRFQFPYMEQARRAPNQRPVMTETVRSAVRTAAELAPELRIVAGGKSMGGRMTSLAHAESPIDGVEGLAFLGFPLHAAGRDSAERGRHLHNIAVPMLFVQGTRDRLANLQLLQALCDSLETKSTIHLLESGDHSFRPLKSSGRSYEELMAEAQTTVVDWVATLDTQARRRT